ncbi:hypothetical protein QO200_09455 [Flavobacterium sp. Arc3]|jgi:uncharacterized membrane protein|uniref:hypothetical protein n=1 Tax=unclassified Flavobacterium TaxID=196869 RepID=UPI00352DFC37
MQLVNRYFSIILLFVSTFFYAQNPIPQDEVRAKIEIEKSEGNIKITGTAENQTDITKSASYKLSVIKNNHANNNNSTNAQEGVFILKPNELIKLSTTQVNIASDDEVIILLIFFNEDKQIISKDRLVLGEEKKKNSR